MAELALIASIVQVADIGLRLSLRLYTFGETVASADRSILTISKNVSFTSSVLKELGHTFENDQGRIHSDNATKTADLVAQECSNVFQEIDKLLLKKVPHLKDGCTDKKARANRLLERLRWPVIKGKIEILNCNLDQMKITLTLMLNVIIYAQQVANRVEPPSVVAEQRQLIEILAQAKEEKVEALKQAQRALECMPLESSNGKPSLMPQAPVTTNLMAMPASLGKEKDFHANTDTISLKSRTPTLTDVAEKPSLFSQLLDEYTRLHRDLIQVIHSEQYRIEQDSRARLRRHIDTAHRSEVGRLVNTHSPPRPTTGQDSAVGSETLPDTAISTSGGNQRVPINTYGMAYFEEEAEEADKRERFLDKIAKQDDLIKDSKVSGSALAQPGMDAESDSHTQGQSVVAAVSHAYAPDRAYVTNSSPEMAIPATKKWKKNRRAKKGKKIVDPAQRAKLIDPPNRKTVASTTARDFADVTPPTALLSSGLRAQRRPTELEIEEWCETVEEAVPMSHKRSGSSFSTLPSIYDRPKGSPHMFRSSSHGQPHRHRTVLEPSVRLPAWNPSSPIPSETTTNSVSVKRARNPSAARRARRKRSERVKGLESEIISLQEEAERWKQIAVSGGYNDQAWGGDENDKQKLQRSIHNVKQRGAKRGNIRSGSKYVGDPLEEIDNVNHQQRFAEAPASIERCRSQTLSRDGRDHSIAAAGLGYPSIAAAGLGLYENKQSKPADKLEEQNELRKAHDAPESGDYSDMYIEGRSDLSLEKPHERARVSASFASQRNEAPKSVLGEINQADKTFERPAISLGSQKAGLPLVEDQAEYVAAAWRPRSLTLKDLDAIKGEAKEAHDGVVDRLLAEWTTVTPPIPGPTPPAAAEGPWEDCNDTS